MLHLYFTSFDSPLDNVQFCQHKSSLPQYIQVKLGKYIRWQDAHAGLFGKILLKQALEDMGLPFDLDDLKYTKYNRPYFDAEIDFNISHSGKHVVCAVSDSNALGIDIEEVKPINTRDFDQFLRIDELDSIERSPNPQREFYYYWTRKEAVIKADGGGLSIPLREIDVTNTTVVIGDKTWFLKGIPMRECYCHIAVDDEVRIDLIKEVPF